MSGLNLNSISNIKVFGDKNTLSRGATTQHIGRPRNLRQELEKFYEKPVAKVSLELILTLVTVIFFALFALRPTLGTMTELTREIEDKRKVNDELTKKLAALATAQGEYVEYSDRFEILDEAIHDRPTLETALFYLEYLVRRENISLAGLQIETFPVGRLVSDTAAAPTSTQAIPTTGTATSEIGVYAIQASFEGDYENILAFFRAVEEVRPLFSVEAFNFSVTTNRDRDTVLKASATIYMYGYQEATLAPRSNRSQLLNFWSDSLDALQPGSHQTNPQTKTGGSRG